jgi:hypothetical protein
MELTKEYFNQQLKNLATKKDLKGFATKVDLKGLATKEDLKPLATKQDVRYGVEELARIVSETVATPMEERFARLESLMDVRLAVQTLQLDMRRIKQALHLK